MQTIYKPTRRSFGTDFRNTHTQRQYNRCFSFYIASSQRTKTSRRAQCRQEKPSYSWDRPSPPLELSLVFESLLLFFLIATSLSFLGTRTLTVAVCDINGEGQKWDASQSLRGPAVDSIAFSSFLVLLDPLLSRPGVHNNRFSFDLFPILSSLFSQPITSHLVRVLLPPRPSRHHNTHPSICVTPLAFSRHLYGSPYRCPPPLVLATHQTAQNSNSPTPAHVR